MENEKKKKGLFERLVGSKKEKKSSSCCNIEIEELPEDTTEKNESEKRGSE